MSSINLYKIDRERIQEFTQDLLRKMDMVKTLEKTARTPDGEAKSFGLTLYLDRPEQQKDISWNWVLEEFEEPAAQVVQAPKGVVLIECEDATEYAVSFGLSFFTVDMYCDRYFGF